MRSRHEAFSSAFRFVVQGVKIYHRSLSLPHSRIEATSKNESESLWAVTTIVLKMISSLVMSTNRSAGSRRVISSSVANCLFHARLVRLLWVVISPDVTLPRILDRWYKIAVLTHLRYPVSH